MKKIDEYVTERSINNPAFAKLVEQENINLEVAVKVRELREKLGMSQREFASLIGKPQSTIARIENGSIILTPTKKEPTTIHELSKDWQDDGKREHELDWGNSEGNQLQW